MGDCKHQWRWDMEPANERGWSCSLCKHKPGEPPGYSPQLDAEFIIEKVSAILFDLHEARFVYVPNGSAGEGIIASIASWCRKTRNHDQLSITSRILEMDEHHATYWRDIGEAIRGGTDPRTRCHCGALATWYQGDKAGCSAHHLPLFDGDVL